MKLIKAFVHHVRTARVVEALADAGYRNLTMHDVRGMLKPLTEEEADFTSEMGTLVICEARLPLVVPDDEVDKVVAITQRVAPVGPNVSGYIDVSPVDQVLPIGGP